MLFHYHRDEFDQRDAERAREERQAQLLLALRELRGAASPFDSGVTHRLAAAMAALRNPEPARRMPPCPEMKEATTP